MSRLLTVLHKLAGNTIDGATYTVDNVGNRTAKTNHLPSAPSEAYTYDAIYQLTQVVQNGSTTTESYTYDPVGNRMSSLAASPWNYNVSNQLTSVAGSPGTTFTYDNNGNTTTKVDASGTTTYTWDYENRLTQVTLPGSGGTVSFTYDPLGRRVRKITPTTTTVFAYDGANIIEETDSSGNALARYSMGLNIDEPLAMLRSSATHFYNADGLGSITSLTDSSGATSATYRYDTFGNLTASSGSVTNPFRYTAREWDGEIGIYYYRARFFDLITGRFLSEDPAGFVGGINLYAYVANNPTNLIDPSGLDHGPYHPPKGVHTKCQKEDSCAVIKGKIWLLQRMIASHEGWDRTMPRPRGGNRHSQEIADRYVELAQCTALYAEKKCNDCEKKEPKWRPVPIPIVGPILDKITDPIADFLEEVWKELKVYPPRRPQPIWGPLPTPSPVPVPIVP